MNLSIIQECVTDSSHAVSEAMDQLYIKQLAIIDNDDLISPSKYACFQESFVQPSSKELSVFKFDNRHILKAIKYFNKGYTKLPFDQYDIDKIKNNLERGKLDIDRSKYLLEFPKDFVNEFKNIINDKSGFFNDGIEELNKQFDCSIGIKASTTENTGTMIDMRFVKESADKLTISKSKGFQLGGLKISMVINPIQILNWCPVKHDLMGQFITSLMLHEIYHNIVGMIEVRNRKLRDDIKKTIQDAGNSNNHISSTSIIATFVERFINRFKVNDHNIDKKRVINRLYVLSKIKDNPKAVKKFEEDVKKNIDKLDDKEIDEYINELNRIVCHIKFKKYAAVVCTACTILVVAIGSLSCGIALLSLVMIAKAASILLPLTEQMQEEYYCDLFAAMYKLPVHFQSFNRQALLNRKHPKKMKKIRELEQWINSKGSHDNHPMNFDRAVTSYKVAKQILDSGMKIKKPIRDYLKYIVDLHDGIDEIDNQKDKKQMRKLDPEAAKDLQKTLRDFVAKTGVTVTESFIIDMCGGEYYGVG